LDVDIRIFLTGAT
jgi:hypothetical protein